MTTVEPPIAAWVHALPPAVLRACNRALYQELRVMVAGPRNREASARLRDLERRVMNVSAAMGCPLGDTRGKK